MAVVTLTFTDVQSDEDGTTHVEAAIENDTLVGTDDPLTMAQEIAIAAFKTAIRMSDAPPRYVKSGEERERTIQPLNPPDHEI